MDTGDLLGSFSFDNGHMLDGVDASAAGQTRTMWAVMLEAVAAVVVTASTVDFVAVVAGSVTTWATETRPSRPGPLTTSVGRVGPLRCVANQQWSRYIEMLVIDVGYRITVWCRRCSRDSIPRWDGTRGGVGTVRPAAIRDRRARRVIEYATAPYVQMQVKHRPMSDCTGSGTRTGAPADGRRETENRSSGPKREGRACGDD